MVLILALSMIAYVVNGVTGLANYLLILQEQLEVVTSADVAFFPEFDPESQQEQINAVYQISAAVAYVLTWIGTVMLLRPYIHRIGKIKFYAILGSAMVYYLIQYPLFVLGYVTPTGESDVEVMNTIVITSIAAVFSGIIFGAAFLSIARTLQKGSALREYMIIAAYGLLLFYVAWEWSGYSGCISSIWTCICLLYRFVVLFNIHRSIFICNFCISRFSTASVN